MESKSPSAVAMSEPKTASTPSDAETFASVDIGSNSFHMVIARFVHGQPHVVDRLRERVRLAAGLDDEGRLDEPTQTRALDTLQRFGERLRDVPPAQVRAVGTNTLRSARNSRSFLKRAAKALGHHIEIVSGQEEARLIYLGVAHSLSDEAERRLVVDIGGGSTECIIGEQFEPLQAASLYMGCVSFSKGYFPDGVLTAENMTRAEMAARHELETIESRFQTLGWDTAVGSSGTVHAIEDILEQSGWSKKGITAKGLKKLRKAVIQAGHVDELSLPGLKADRSPVLAGGLAILDAVFESFDVATMTASNGALREGVLYDLVGRSRHEDVRDRTIQSLVLQYHVDRSQAERVEATALDSLSRVQAAWDLQSPDFRQLLAWGARIHEIGLVISYSGHHKHGAYLVANSELPGFSRDDQEFLAALIRGHRRKIRASYFEELPQVDELRALRLCILFRLAVLLNRPRSPRAVPPFELRATKESLELRFPSGWLDGHPLARVDLQEEAAYIKKVGVQLKFA